MKRNTLRRLTQAWWICIGLAFCGGSVRALRADQVQMQNGDRYVGSVLSLDAETLTLKNEFLGTIRLPRSRVAAVAFGVYGLPAPHAGPAHTNGVAKSAGGAQANNPASLAAQLAEQSNLLQQVEAQFLTGADPEAKAKFNDLLSGLMTGKLNVDDIRAQAQSTARQVRAARKDLGEDAGWVLDGYLAILDQFVKDTAVGGEPNPPAKPPPQPKPAPEE